MKQHKYHWKYINVLVDHDIPLKKLKLYDGLTNWCACGIQDLGRNDFLGHVAELHHGMIKKDSQINRPFWLDWIFYQNTELEKDFCYPTSNSNNSN